MLIIIWSFRSNDLDTNLLGVVFKTFSYFTVNIQSRWLPDFGNWILFIQFLVQKERININHGFLGMPVLFVALVLRNFLKWFEAA